MQNKSIIEKIREALPSFREKNPTLIPPITLAYIGDTIYDLFVRSYIVCNFDFNADRLHKTAITFVCAKSQSQAYKIIADDLTNDESAIFHRGRNAYSHAPRNVRVTDYRIATGLEALIGWLYLSGNDDRLSYIMNKILDNQINKEK